MIGVKDLFFVSHRESTASLASSQVYLASYVAVAISTRTSLSVSRPIASTDFLLGIKIMVHFLVQAPNFAWMMYVKMPSF